MRLLLYLSFVSAKKVKLFAVFFSNAWNFCEKLYKFMWLSYLHLNAKWHLMTFEYDEVIDILAPLLSDFAFAPKHSKIASLKQHNVF